MHRPINARRYGYNRNRRIGRYFAICDTRIDIWYVDAEIEIDRLDGDLDGNQTNRNLFRDF